MRASALLRLCALACAAGATPSAALEIQLAPAQPSTADEVIITSTTNCPISEELAAFPAGPGLWYVLFQPLLGDPPECSFNPAPNVSISLGRLARGFHTVFLLGPSVPGGAPIELASLVFEVQQADSTSLPLSGERFRVGARWTLPSGMTGDARAVPLTSDSGSFWFFRPDNLELMIKVLDGCAVNDRFWVLAAGLTDVGVEILIEDTATGSRWMHTSPPGSAFGPVQDTGALPCP